ncbi:MAG: aminotransferase class I/II-fold pyridoxal phosphate-dependent enzyme, partial [Acidimicrobiales bacterium]
GRLVAPDQRADVRDEAFYALATGRWSRRDPGAVVVGSLTKLFACPGLRAGYVVAPGPELATRFRARQPAWSVNALAVALVPDLLAIADLGAWAGRIAGLRRELVGVLSSHHLAPLASEANWVLVPGATGLRHALALHGIVVRDCSSFGLPDHVRVAVPGPAGLERLDQALTALGR